MPIHTQLAGGKVKVPAMNVPPDDGEPSSRPRRQSCFCIVILLCSIVAIVAAVYVGVIGVDKISQLPKEAVELHIPEMRQVMPTKHCFDYSEEQASTLLHMLGREESNPSPGVKALVDSFRKGIREARNSAMTTYELSTVGKSDLVRKKTREIAKSAKFF